MTESGIEWSPADHPQAIAVSEAQWWQRAAELAVHRLGDPDDERISWFSSRQIDARQLVMALRQLLGAERLLAGRLRELGLDRAGNGWNRHAGIMRTPCRASNTCATG